MRQNRLVIGAIFVNLMGLIGFMLPQNLGGVQKLQSIFIFAEEQLNISSDCSPAAFGNLPQVKDIAPASCNSIIRARDIYDGLTYPEALSAFKRELLQDRFVFAGISGSAGILLYLFVGMLIFSAPKSNRLLLRD